VRRLLDASVRDADVSTDDVERVRDDGVSSVDERAWGRRETRTTWVG
jgi:hypothetical protein